MMHKLFEVFRNELIRSSSSSLVVSNESITISVVFCFLNIEFSFCFSLFIRIGSVTFEKVYIICLKLSLDIPFKYSIKFFLYVILC